MRARLAGWIVAACLAATVVHAEDNVLRAVPADVMVAYVIHDPASVVKKAKQTSIYALLTDPEMRAFARPLKDVVVKKATEQIKGRWAEKLGIKDWTKDVPMPTGRVAVAYRMEMRKMTFSYGGDEDMPPMTREVSMPHPILLAVAEMGTNAEKAEKMLGRLRDLLVEEQEWKHERKTARGTTVHLLTPPEPDEQEPDEAPRMTSPAGKPDPTCYAFHNGQLLFSNSEKMLKHALALATGAAEENLAQDALYRRTIAALAHPGDIVEYMDIKQWIAVMASMSGAAGAQASQNLQQQVRALGFDNAQTYVRTFEIAPNARQDLRMRIEVHFQGPLRGVPALINAPPKPLTIGAMVPKSTAYFVSAWYDPARVFEQIAQIAAEMKAPDVKKQAQQAMMPTAGPEGTGPAPVDFQKDLIEQLAQPLVLMGRFDKPFTAADAAKWMLTLGVRNPGTLDTTLGRVHNALIARGNKQRRRTMRDVNLYLTPFSMPFFMSPMMGGGPPEPDHAFAIIGENLVFGDLRSVQQGILDRQADRRQTLASDPMFQHARRALPATACIYAYADHRKLMEIVWDRLRDAAGKRDTPRPPRPRPFGDPQEAGPLEAWGDAPPPYSSDPFEMFARSMPEGVDLTALPPFRKIRRHFGATVAFLQGTPDGLAVEMIMLKPPAE